MATFDTSGTAAFFRFFDLSSFAAVIFPDDYTLTDDFNSTVNGVLGEDLLDLALPPGFGQSLLGTGLQIDGSGVTGGQINAIFWWTEDGSGRHYDYSFSGIDIAAVDFFAAAFSATRDDDRALFALMTAGDDTFILSRFPDQADGGTGKDVIRGFGSQDALLGNQGQDRLFGGGGSDLLKGGKGNDVLAGGRGEDGFLFAAANGHDRIKDFDPTQDVILLKGLTGPGDYVLTDDVDHAVLTYGTTVIEFQTGVMVADISEADNIIGW